MSMPHLLAQTFSLDGEWQFAVDSSGVFHIDIVKDKAEWRRAKVPLSWQAQFSDLRDYQGVAWYRKPFVLPKLKSSETVLVEFNAVDYMTEVFVNGKAAGKHEGGYTPFAFDIRQFAKTGLNELIVRVMDPVANEQGTEGVSYLHIPHGKQSWYEQTSGLWQSVQISIKPKRRITQVHVTPTIDGKVSVDVKLSVGGNQKSNEQLAVRIFDAQRREVARTSKMISRLDTEARLEGFVKNPILWSFATPLLYEAVLSLGEKDKAVERFGFRQIEAKNKRLYLNGEPFYLIAALDQDFYPETIYTTPSEDYLRDEMMKAKQIGLNMLRCHIKVPDQRYLKVADEIGMMVWYEIPNWDVFTPEAARRGEETFDAMLARDWNHPSLVIISLINESWGLDLKQAEQRQWLLSAFGRAKQKAIGRLIVDNSACWGNFHLKTDINDYHTYWAIPENRHRFDQTLNDVSKRPQWLFSEHGDAEETGDEPLLISEFGNWGLPKLPDKLPWWFERDFLGREVTMPKGVHQRFKDFHYDEIFGSYNQLAEESQRAQFMALKYEIEQIRLSPAIQGYVITEFTDINWECNGLLDMWRNQKIYADEVARIQQQDVIVLRPQKFNYWDEETVEIRTFLSHYSAVELNEAQLKWTASSGAHGEMAVPAVERAGMKEIYPVRFSPAKVPSPQRLRIEFALEDARGTILAKNDCEIFVYPKAQNCSNLSINIHDPTRTLGAFTASLRDLGFRVDQPFSENSLTVTNVLDKELVGRLERGGSALCLLDTNTAMPTQFSLALTSREAEWYDGNWASNLNWLRNDRRPFHDLAFGKFLGFEAALVAPQIVITGVPPAAFSDVLAGMYVGWLHLNSAYMLQVQVGRGKLILCTLRLRENVPHDPYALMLFHELARYAVSSACVPVWKVSSEGK